MMPKQLMSTGSGDTLHHLHIHSTVAKISAETSGAPGGPRHGACTREASCCQQHAILNRFKGQKMKITKQLAKYTRVLATSDTL